MTYLHFEDHGWKRAADARFLLLNYWTIRRIAASHSLTSKPRNR